MSRHWKPDEQAVRLRPARGASSRSPAEPHAWSQPQDYAPPAKRQALPPGALAGLIFVAAACAGVVIVIDQAFGRRDVFAEELESDRNAVQLPPG